MLLRRPSNVDVASLLIALPGTTPALLKKASVVLADVVKSTADTANKLRIVLVRRRGRGLAAPTRTDIEPIRCRSASTLSF